MVAGFAALHDGIAHVKVKNFQERTDLYLKKELDRLRGLNGQELRGLVLDLRNNPGGLLDQAVAVGDRFLPGNLTVVWPVVDVIMNNKSVPQYLDEQRALAEK